MHEDIDCFANMCNYHGKLQVTERDNKYYMGLIEYDDDPRVEIPFSLYKELVKFQKEWEKNNA